LLLYPAVNLIYPDGFFHTRYKYFYRIKETTYMRSKNAFALCFCCMIFFSATACNTASSEDNSDSDAFDFKRQSSSTSTIISSASNGSLSQSKLKISEPFIGVNMVTNKAGYAITKSLHILKTEDGWTDCTDLLALPNPPKNAGAPVLFLLDDKTVYTAAFTKFGISVEKSIDAGTNWSVSTIELRTDNAGSGYGRNLHMSFVNASEGFLLTSGQPAAGIMKKILYQTSDGGENWHPMDSKFELDGYTTGMTFFDSNTGLITCTYHGRNDIPIYRSTDGGRRWAVVSVPIPQKFSSSAERDYYADAYQPAIYGKGRTNAKMELFFCSGDKREPYFYSTENEGASWKIDGISNRFIAEYTFTDAENGFGIDDHGKLYTTQDGGLNWF
jgi:photosystem II stability/assembly factor-like uncharacterized protein